MRISIIWYWYYLTRWKCCSTKIPGEIISSKSFRGNCIFTNSMWLSKGILNPCWPNWSEITKYLRIFWSNGYQSLLDKIHASWVYHNNKSASPWICLSAPYYHNPWIKIHFSTTTSKIFLYYSTTNSEFWTDNKLNVSVYKDKKFFKNPC